MTETRSAWAVTSISLSGGVIDVEFVSPSKDEANKERAMLAAQDRGRRYSVVAVEVTEP